MSRWIETHADLLLALMSDVEFGTEPRWLVAHEEGPGNWCPPSGYPTHMLRWREVIGLHFDPETAREYRVTDIRCGTHVRATAFFDEP